MLTDQQIIQALRQSYINDFHMFVKDAFGVLHPDEEFADNWHIRYLCSELQRIVGDVAGNRPKQHDLIINLPPRSLKTFVTTIALGAWSWLFRPSLKYLNTSYSIDMAAEHSMFSRRLISSEWYKRMVNFKLTQDQNSKDNYGNNRGGSRIAAATGGTVTGRGANIVIIDDPVNPMQARSDAERIRANKYFDETLSTRLNRPGKDVFIVIMQRLHEQDLTGHLVSGEGARHWKHIVIPGEVGDNVRPVELRRHYSDGLFFPERFSRADMDKWRVRLGSYGYSGQVLQRPSPEGGGIIKRKWLESYVNLNELPMDVVWDFVIDPAYTKNESNDPSALMAFAKVGEQMVIRSCVSVWKEMPELMKYTQQFVDANGGSHQSKVYIEPKASGLSLKQTLFKETSLNVIEDKAPTTDKRSRVESCTPFIESGRVRLVEGPWNDGFSHECVTFPTGKHDDRVDCLTMAISRMQKPIKNIFFI